MAELYRLRGQGEKGYVDLVLTETHLELEPSEEWLAELEGSLEKAREAGSAPGVIGWIASKAVTMASNFVKKVLEPHPLAEVEYIWNHDSLRLQLGRIKTNLGSLMVDPSEAYVFDAKFRDAKAKLK